MPRYTLDFSQIKMRNLPQVGGKNASLGEMFQALAPEGIRVPDGFATHADAYWEFIDFNNLRGELTSLLATLDTREFSNLREVGEKARGLVMGGEFPDPIRSSIEKAYRALAERTPGDLQVAVRSSATAEDLPSASFAGQLESYLNIRGEHALLETCRRCYASLFTDRVIKYRTDNGFPHMQVAVSVGVQRMVRSDKACAGVGFTLEPETGFRNVVVLTGSWGLGENVVQGTVNLDQFTLFKPALASGKKAILNKKLGEKEKTLVYLETQADARGDYSTQSTVNVETPLEMQRRYILNDDEIEELGRWCLRIEKHYRRPMDIEWAKDGLTNELFIVQARPETVHASGAQTMQLHTYTLKRRGNILATGISVGSKIASGIARRLSGPEESDKLQKGEVLITEVTNPDWDPILKKAAAIITAKGGRTSHAAIVARESGAVAVVGAGDGIYNIPDGQQITVSCAEGETGFIYEGALEWDEKQIDMKNFRMPKTKPLLILGDPDKAFKSSLLPSRGVGLMRLEFVIANSIGIHPVALARFDAVSDQEVKAKIEALTRMYARKKDYFVERLAQAVGTLAAAFHPREVIVRMSDFKSNEYANLLGGKQFEPEEENPMIGFRGASRYYHERYRDGFQLECEAILRVREDMGLTNVKVMIPFCRTLEEGSKVLEVMAEYGLKRGENGLEVYVMVEIPSNVVLAREFAELFDGFSIGSNDLTQLTLGLDRDSALVSDLFNEKNAAVLKMISDAIRSARKTKTPIGLCGQAPSDFPEFARFLVKQGIGSVSFNEDALLQGIENINAAEAK